MQSGNGIDLAAIYQLLEAVARRIGAVETRLDEHTLKLNELVSAVNQNGGKLDDLAHEVSELRLSVNRYHGSVVGMASN